MKATFGKLAFDCAIVVTLLIVMGRAAQADQVIEYNLVPQTLLAPIPITITGSLSIDLDNPSQQEPANVIFTYTGPSLPDLLTGEILYTTTFDQIDSNMNFTATGGGAGFTQPTDSYVRIDFGNGTNQYFGLQLKTADGSPPQVYAWTIFAGTVPQIEFDYSGDATAFAPGTNYIATAVPEPTSVSLAGIGAAAFGVFGWLKRRSQTPADR
jgi:hypothetical protein